MNETHPEIAKKVVELMNEKTPQERFAMGLSMNRTSREIVTSGILHENPGISPSELRHELFLRYYRDDFDAETREKILKYLEKV